MHRTVVLNVVGLTGGLLGDSTPNLQRFAKQGCVRPLETVFPAVTCTVQSTFTTGLPPSGHGCVANGWYFRDIAEVNLWRQANQLVAGEKIWEAARRRDPAFTCAKLFWWYNMYSSADYSVTPRPIYWADGLKLPDIYTDPASLRDELVFRLGEFPLFNFWGPNADISSTRWIARCARHVYDTRRPTLTLVYLPHLDYNLQRFGPDDPRIQQDLRAVDAVCGELIEHVRKDGARVIVLSEYGITRVTGAVHINRILRERGLIRVRIERGVEKLDPGASDAFAVADHQAAHIYVRRKERIGELKQLLEKVPGVGAVLAEEEKRAIGIEHERSGDLVAVAAPDSWFSYYYWLDDDKAPEFARTVDIHRKPGYDPVELFLDPTLSMAPVRIALTLLKKKLGFRYLMDVIPLDASLVKGSHGRLAEHPDEMPVFMSSDASSLPSKVPAGKVKELVLQHLFAERPGELADPGVAAALDAR